MATPIQAGGTVAGQRAAFTLTEVMVATFVSVLLITALMSTFVHQRSVMRAQQLIGEMHQNTRYAMDTVCRDIRTAGYGLDVRDAHLDDWISWVLNFTENPMIVEGSAGAPDALVIAAAFEEPVTTLAVAAASGANQIVVADASEFNTFDRRVIYIGRATTARITAISGNTLTISAHPTGSVGLKHDFPLGAPVELVEMIRYEWHDATDYPDYPYLSRHDRSEVYAHEWMRVSAGYIEDFQVTRNGDLLNVEITGVVAHPDRYYTHPDQNDSFRRETLTCAIRPRN